MPAEAERCSALSLALGEPLIGTASTVPNWVMLEHPGPWGPDALRASRLAPELAASLRTIDRQFGVRVVLIRRHGQGVSEGGSVRCFLSHTGPGRPWLEGLTLGRPSELLDLDLSPTDWSVPPGLGEAVGGPLFLVCTHGRRDPCCAERGRPLARAVDAAYKDGLWESSHIGGDRFAGNLVCFRTGSIWEGSTRRRESPRPGRMKPGPSTSITIGAAPATPSPCRRRSRSSGGARDSPASMTSG